MLNNMSSRIDLDDRKEVSFMRIGDNFAESLRNKARTTLLNRSHDNERSGVIAMAKWIRDIRTKISIPSFYYDCATKGYMSYTFYPTLTESTSSSSPQLEKSRLFNFLNEETCLDGLSRWGMGEYFIYILGKVCFELNEERVTSLAELIKLPPQLNNTFTVKTNWTHKKSDCFNPDERIHWSNTLFKIPSTPETPPEPFIVISWGDNKSGDACVGTASSNISLTSIESNTENTNVLPVETTAYSHLKCFNEVDSITHL